MYGLFMGYIMYMYVYVYIGGSYRPLSELEAHPNALNLLLTINCWL